MSDKKIIMVVEDDRTIAEVCQIKLQMDNFKVLLANNGLEALELLKNHKPDVILLDIVMPKMNGFDFLEALKKNSDFRDTKVVIMSNLSQETDIERGKELGANDYLVKSDSGINEITNKIKAWLS